MNNIQWKQNTLKQERSDSATFLKDSIIQKVQAFHQSFRAYNETPLWSLPGLAQELGVATIHVKDESYRFGLNAFKVLGASYAIGAYLAQRLQLATDDLTEKLLCAAETKQKLGAVTFVTATDGNHGRGVAWAARHMGQNSVVYMPKGSSQIRLHNIQAEGATASITDLNYDEAVRLAAQQAKENGWIVIQDTAWEGYEDIPRYIMQGYASLAREILTQLETEQSPLPTHLFLQAGVGSFAGAIAGYFVQKLGKRCPKIIVVEPDQADCLYRSAVAEDGNPHVVTGPMPSIMAGLACGEPNRTGWEILRDSSDFFFSCSDHVTAHGMRVLGNPLRGDHSIISGESGAVTTGLASLLCRCPTLNAAKESLDIGPDARILLISTEGDTDPTMYRSIVWDGAFSNADK